MESFNRTCQAAQVVSPVVYDLETDHLRRFNLSWDILCKHMYQSIIYNNPLIQNNLPIFISQVK